MSLLLGKTGKLVQSGANFGGPPRSRAPEGLGANLEDSSSKGELMNIKGLAATLVVVGMSGCASTTVLHSIPEGARVMDGTKELGKTPYTSTDSES